MRFLLICFALAIVSLSFAQEQPSFPKKTIKDPNGNVYWPLSLPVYVQLSSLPDAKDAIMLSNVKEANMKDYAHPMKWDGHGIHYIRHIDNENEKLHKNEISFPVYVDGINPVTTITFQGAPQFLVTKLFFGKNLSGTLQAIDEMSGVEGIYKSVNGATYDISNTLLNFSEEKEYTIKYFSVDRTGNAEEPKTKIFTIDITAPASTYQVNIDHLEGKILSPRTNLTLSSSDNLSGVKKTEYYFDENKPATYSGKTNSGSLADGDHVLTFFSTDNVSNGEEPKQFSFYMDTKAPEVSSAFDANFFKAPNGRMYIAKATTIQLSATDNKAGVKEIYYTINSGAEQLFSSAFTLPQKQGSYSVKFKGIDNVNNKGTLISNDQLSNIFLDDTPPTLSHQIDNPKVFTRDTLFITKDAAISLSSVDQESGSAKIDYTIDGASSGVYAAAFQVSSEGKHTVSYTGTDNVNNRASKNFIFIVDNTAPEIFWHMSLDKIGTQKLNSKSGELPLYASGTSLYLAATDKVVGTKGITYSLNGQGEIPYSQPIKMNIKGVYSLKIKAVDYLGNQNVSDVIEFVIQ